MKKKFFKYTLFFSLILLFNIFITSNLMKNPKRSRALPETLGMGTKAWASTEVVSTESTSPSMHPSIAVDNSGNLHLVWADWTNYSGSGTDWDIFYKCWNASTGSWTATEVVSTESTGNSFYPSVAVDPVGDVHVAWDDWSGLLSVDYKRRNTTDGTWTSVITLALDSMNSTMAVDGAGNVHVAYSNMFNFSIEYRRWNATTGFWTSPETVSTESTGFLMGPAIAIDATGNLHVTWIDNTNYSGAGIDNDIFYKYWNASMGIWYPTEVVSTESSSESYNPSIAVDSSENVYLVWHDWTNYSGSGWDWDIFYKNGTTFSWSITEVISTESDDTSQSPTVTIDGSGNVHVSWADLTNYSGSGTDWDIFYKRWDATTGNWTLTEVVSTGLGGQSQLPTIATDGNTSIYVAWDDTTNYSGSGSDKDIFLNRLVTELTAPVLDIIFPNPDFDGLIDLNWNYVSGATQYYIYKDTSNITSVTGLTPISTISQTSYQDPITNNGTYYYVIVAGNAEENSSMSNCENVTVVVTIPAAPILDPILPNPSTNGTIDLNWNASIDATNYHVYRNVSTITSVIGLTPIASPSMNYHQDTLTNNGTYYYVIVAENTIGNSSISNCENVTVVVTIPAAPILDPILPNPSTNGIIDLNWNASIGATNYHIYRNISTITSVIGLTPIASPSVNYHQDTLTNNGTYYYVIVAENTIGNSSISNCENVTVAIPPDQGLILINEVFTGGPDWIELVNLGSPQDMTGWTLHCWDSGYQIYNLPAGFTLGTNAFVQIHESSGSNDADDLYWNDNIDWVASDDGAVTLTNDLGEVIDHVQFNGWSGSPLPGTQWSGSFNSGSSDVKRRNSITDTDQASDWSSGGSATPKAANPGQVFGPPDAPYLYYMWPNPTDVRTINLDWSYETGADYYYVYRSTSLITDVVGLDPIAQTSSTSYTDTVPTEGTYYYVIVAGNSQGNSSVSNCYSVKVVFPSWISFAIVLLVFAGVIGAVTTIQVRNVRKKSISRPKMSKPFKVAAKYPTIKPPEVPPAPKLGSGGIIRIEVPPGSMNYRQILRCQQGRNSDSIFNGKGES